MENLKTFHGETAIKEKYVARVKAHAEADEIAKGFYWEGGKGCAVGCTIEGSDHNKYETELGIPAEVAYLEDTIFENLPNGEAKKFPLQFLEAVGVGKDLSKVTPQMVIWQFEDPTHGLKNIPEVAEDKELMDLCEEVVALYKRELEGHKASEDEYYKLYIKIEGARAQAWAWARAQAWAWARAQAWAWARAGAWAQAWARAQAWAWARAQAWAWAGAQNIFYERMLAMRDYLLECIKNAPDA